jgi:hypothetical protein
MEMLVLLGLAANGGGGGGGKSVKNLLDRLADLLRFVKVLKKLFFGAMNTPSAGSGAAPLTCSSMINHFPFMMVVSISAQRPKTDFRSVGSSPARLVIHTHQKASSNSTLVIAASSPGARFSSAPPNLSTDIERLIRGGRVCAGGYSRAEDLAVPSSANPEERKSAQDGVVGRPRSLPRECCSERRPLPIVLAALPFGDVLKEFPPMSENPVL